MKPRLFCINISKKMNAFESLNNSNTIQLTTYGRFFSQICYHYIDIQI